MRLLLCCVFNLCSSNIQIRRDAITLLSIQHTITQKEADLAAYQAQIKPRVLALQKQKVLQMPVTDLLVNSVSQKNDRIQQEVEEQLLAAKRLAETEHALQTASAFIASSGDSASVASGDDVFIKKVCVVLDNLLDNH